MPESHEIEEEQEDTVIRSCQAELESPNAIDEDGVDLTEAPTLIVSRADPRHSERTFVKIPDPAPAPPQTHYALRIGENSLIPLEVPAYIGRRPSTPRIPGTRIPRLVMVPSPLREVSSTHVQILQQAETVVVTDLGSSNGTRVTMAGFPPRTLRQGESLVVGAEAVVDIGDGIRIVIVTLPDNAVAEGTK